MDYYIQVLLFVIAVIALFWFGFTLFFNVILKPPPGKALPGKVPPDGDDAEKFRKNQYPKEAHTGNPRYCPVCSAELLAGELVQSMVFPSLNGGKDRLMHIKGCVHCLNGDKSRICPVCSRILEDGEIIVARIFERAHHRSHVHVLGCTKCHIRKRRP